MRKIKNAICTLAALFAAALIVCSLVILPKRLAFDGGDRYSFYIGNTSKNCRVVTTDGVRAPFTRLTLKSVSGESATYSSLDWQAYLKEVNGKVLFCEELSDSVNYYCTADLPYSVELYGKTVNLHICVKENTVIMGTPIIFGGY